MGVFVEADSGEGLAAREGDLDSPEFGRDGVVGLEDGLAEFG